MPATRNIKQNALGGWDILRPGDRRASFTSPTRQAALARARGQVRREGGGEVRVLDRYGKIAATSHVARPTAGRRRVAPRRDRAAA